jgi:hypothetical protein
LLDCCWFGCQQLCMHWFNWNWTSLKTGNWITTSGNWTWINKHLDISKNGSFVLGNMGKGYTQHPKFGKNQRILSNIWA